jgi:uncharacterized damage-inducible protein DinB
LSFAQGAADSNYEERAGMSGEQVGANQVIVGLLERATNQIKLATDGATDEQLYYRPTTNANSIAWLVWHLSRLQDLISSSLSGEAQVWYTDRWAEQFALPPDLPNDATGWGDSAEQVAAFRVERATLFGYMEAAHRVARERVARLTPEQLEQTVAWGTAETPLLGPAWRVLITLLNDSIQHTGQINYIRGLVSEPDWRRRADDAWRAADLGRTRSWR